MTVPRDTSAYIGWLNTVEVSSDDLIALCKRADLLSTSPPVEEAPPRPDTGLDRTIAAAARVAALCRILDSALLRAWVGGPAADAVLMPSILFAVAAREQLLYRDGRLTFDVQAFCWRLLLLAQPAGHA